ncbi:MULTISPECIES: hypothetical protein [Romboutsia]|uniref:hypothetical protein n=1 Tax=Romboutsia TaxID=1501226 RepID=UPI00258298D2|nr:MULTISPECIES: hypothetical protein [Romboutsia]
MIQLNLAIVLEELNRHIKELESVYNSNIESENVQLMGVVCNMLLINSCKLTTRWNSNYIKKSKWNYV